MPGCKLVFEWQDENGANGIGYTVSIPFGGEQYLLVADDDAEADIGWINANLKSIFICADHDMTITPKLAGVPQTAKTLKAGLPFVWYTGSGIANPFSGDVDSIHFHHDATNPTDGEMPSVQIRINDNPVH